MDENQSQNNSSFANKLNLPTAIVIAGLLIGGGFVLSNKFGSNEKVVVESPNVRNVNSSLSLKEVMRPIDVNDHVLGNANARIVIVEYSDPECPFCKMFHTTMRQIMQDYGKSGNVAWVYRHYPIAELHKNAFVESVAMECASVVGTKSSFWEYTNRLYEVTPSNDGLDQAELPKIAAAVNLSVDKFNTCLSSGEFDNRILADSNNAQELGILGTPYSILIDTKTQDYYPLEGAYPFDQLKTAIDLILASYTQASSIFDRSLADAQSLFQECEHSTACASRLSVNDGATLSIVGKGPALCDALRALPPTVRQGDRHFIFGAGLNAGVALLEGATRRMTGIWDLTAGQLLKDRAITLEQLSVCAACTWT